MLKQAALRPDVFQLRVDRNAKPPAEFAG